MNGGNVNRLADMSPPSIPANSSSLAGMHGGKAIPAFLPQVSKAELLSGLTDAFALYSQGMERILSGNSVSDDDIRSLSELMKPLARTLSTKMRSVELIPLSVSKPVPGYPLRQRDILNREHVGINKCLSLFDQAFDSAMTRLQSLLAEGRLECAEALTRLSGHVHPLLAYAMAAATAREYRVKGRARKAKALLLQTASALGDGVHGFVRETFDKERELALAVDDAAEHGPSSQSESLEIKFYPIPTPYSNSYCVTPGPERTAFVSIGDLGTMTGAIHRFDPMSGTTTPFCEGCVTVGMSWDETSRTLYALTLHRKADGAFQTSLLMLGGAGEFDRHVNLRDIVGVDGLFTPLRTDGRRLCVREILTKTVFVLDQSTLALEKVIKGPHITSSTNCYIEGNSLLFPCLNHKGWIVHNLEDSSITEFNLDQVSNPYICSTHKEGEYYTLSQNYMVNGNISYASRYAILQHISRGNTILELSQLYTGICIDMAAIRSDKNIWFILACYKHIITMKAGKSC